MSAPGPQDNVRTWPKCTFSSSEERHASSPEESSGNIGNENICVRPCQIPFGARGLQLNEMKIQLFTVTHYDIVANAHIFYDRVGLKCVIFTAVV